MLKLINSKLRRLCSNFRYSLRRRSKPHRSLLIKTYPKPIHHTPAKINAFRSPSPSSIHPHRSVSDTSETEVVVIKIATFNAALFSMAPAVTKSTKSIANFTKSIDFSRPKSILKTPKQKPRKKSNFRVSINLPENEISLLKNMKSKSRISGKRDTDQNADDLLRKSLMIRGELNRKSEDEKQSKSVAEVLKDLNLDLLALQNVKADEENEMKPLSELAEALDLNYYAFAESWAPQFGNAVLSRWPIKRFHVQKLLDDSDFRNALKATIDVPGAGEVNFYCTHLDHLDEELRTKQINSIINQNDEPHLLAGGLNSLCETDYSTERWTDIVKYYQEIGKPTPKANVMRFVKNKQYIDAKDFAGECQPVVIIAKGQSVQGTCKYGTRLDYLLASPSFQFEFVPGSYSVYSSQGTSDHHIVKADFVKRKGINKCQSSRNEINSSCGIRQKMVRICDGSSCKRIWSMTIT